MKNSLLTVGVEPEYLAPRYADTFYRKVTRQALSVDGYSPVLVTIRVGSDTAVVWTKPLPGGSGWRQPNAETRRALLDEVLHRMGMRRVPGTRQEAPTADGWCWWFQIERI